MDEWTQIYIYEKLTQQPEDRRFYGKNEDIDFQHFKKTTKIRILLLIILFLFIWNLFFYRHFK